MIMSSDITNKFRQLQSKIEAAEKTGESIVPYVKEQIALLWKAHDEFISLATSQGYSLNDFKLAEIEIQQFSAMKSLAAKIGESTEEYDNHIKQCKIRVFGEENYKRFFTD